VSNLWQYNVPERGVIKGRDEETYNEYRRKENEG
jgi:hypothetical protein